MLLALNILTCLELQNVHLNEIIQFDFAEVIRQVTPLGCNNGLSFDSLFLPLDSCFKIQSWQI